MSTQNLWQPCTCTPTLSGFACVAWAVCSLSDIAQYRNRAPCCSQIARVLARPGRLQAQQRRVQLPPPCSAPLCKRKRPQRCRTLSEASGPWRHLPLRRWTHVRMRVQRLRLATPLQSAADSTGAMTNGPFMHTTSTTTPPDPMMAALTAWCTKSASWSRSQRAALMKSST